MTSFGSLPSPGEAHVTSFGSLPSPGEAHVTSLGCEQVKYKYTCMCVFLWCFV